MYTATVFYMLHYVSIRCLVPSKNSFTHLHVAILRCRPEA